MKKRILALILSVSFCLVAITGSIFPAFAQSNNLYNYSGSSLFANWSPSLDAWRLTGMGSFGQQSLAACIGAIIQTTAGSAVGYLDLGGMEVTPGSCGGEATPLELDNLALAGDTLNSVTVYSLGTFNVLNVATTTGNVNHTNGVYGTPQYQQYTVPVGLTIPQDGKIYVGAGIDTSGGLLFNGVGCGYSNETINDYPAHPDWNVFTGFSLPSLAGIAETLIIQFADLPQEIQLFYQLGNTQDVRTNCPIIYDITLNVTTPAPTTTPLTLPPTWTPASTYDYPTVVYPTVPTEGFYGTYQPTFATATTIPSATNMVVTVYPVTLTDTCQPYTLCGNGLFPTVIWPTWNLPTFPPVNTLVFPTLAPTTTLSPTVGPSATGATITPGGPTLTPTSSPAPTLTPVGPTATTYLGHSYIVTAVSAGLCNGGAGSQTSHYDLNSDDYALSASIPGVGTVAISSGGPFTGVGDFGGSFNLGSYSIAANTPIAFTWTVSNTSSVVESVNTRYFDCTTGSLYVPLTSTPAPTSSGATPTLTVTGAPITATPNVSATITPTSLAVFVPTFQALAQLSPPPDFLTPAAQIGQFAGQALGILNVSSTIPPIQSLITTIKLIFLIVVAVNLACGLIPLVLFLWKKFTEFIQTIKPL